MRTYQIVKITFESDIKVHPQAVIGTFDFKASKWIRKDKGYAKDDDLIKYSLQKTGENVFVLLIEQVDLYGLDLGKWDEQDHPEREKLIREVLSEIQRGLGSEVRIIQVDRLVE